MNNNKRTHYVNNINIVTNFGLMM